MLNLDTSYPSPRWSGEILDCSMPLTFDQYSRCSFNCLYCFSYFQRALKEHNPLFVNHTKNYLLEEPTTIDPEKFVDLFTRPIDGMNLTSGLGQFKPYIERGIAFQWGGLSDPFDMFEKKYGVGLKVLQELCKIKYPICFSTKGTWWARDERYIECFRKAEGAWNVKVSIICKDEAKAKKVEQGVASPAERLKAIELIDEFSTGGVTLRLRPFIIGLSNLDFEELITDAARAGVTAVSTEFLCLEGRANQELLDRYVGLSEAIGFDIVDFYRRNSVGAGYMRLNQKVKQPFIDKMHNLCNKLGVRFYVSDAHHKDRCANGSCCGLGNKWNYQRGQFTEMLTIAKRRYDVSLSLFPGDIPKAEKASEITFAEMDSIGHLKEIFGEFLWHRAENFNTSSTVKRGKLWRFTMYDYIKLSWNDVNDNHSPYRYFSGLLRPRLEADDDGNVIYYYKPYNT